MAAYHMVRKPWRYRQTDRNAIYSTLFVVHWTTDT